MRNAARAAAEEGSRARGKALVRALAVLALAGAAIIGTQFLACGEKSAEAPADPVELEKSDPRVAELLVPCVNGGFYDRDTSDVVAFLIEKLEHGQPEVLKRAKQELGELGEDAMDELRRTAPPAIIRAFSGKGGKIPFGTFVPGNPRKDTQAQVGLEHSAGPRALQQLREAGVPLPAGWRMRQDHGRRGIVCDVPRDENPETIVRWIIDSSLQLCEIVLTGWWTTCLEVLPSRERRRGKY